MARGKGKEAKISLRSETKSHTNYQDSDQVMTPREKQIQLPSTSGGSSGGNTNRIFTSALKSVIKIYCTFTRPSFSSPWQMERQSTCTSSGFVISGRRILCNAHGTTTLPSPTSLSHTLQAKLCGMPLPHIMPIL